MDAKKECFVNMRNSATLQIRQAMPKEYTHHGNIEVLLVLCHLLTDTVCHLNALTIAFNDVPMMSTVPEVTQPLGDEDNDGDNDAFYKYYIIKAASVFIDTDNLRWPRSNPIMVLCLNWGIHKAIVCTEPYTTSGEPST